MMKKKLFSLLLAVAILCSIMSSTAFAMAQTDGETVVSYTVSSSYVINIPASLNMNEDPNLRITASSINTTWGQRVSVFIDGARTYENGGNFYLYKDKGTENEAKIKCTLRYSTTTVDGTDAEVGRFDNGDITNFYDPLQFEPVTASSTPPGTYTGTIYFRITMS